MTTIAGWRWRPTPRRRPICATISRRAAAVGAAWEAVADDLRIVRGVLVEAPPSALERRLRIAFANRAVGPAGALWVPRVERLAQAAAIGALAALAAAQTLPPALASMGPALVCLTGASVGFAGRAVFDALELRSGW